MPEAARFPSFGLLIASAALLGVAFFGHHVGTIVLAVVGIGLAAKWYHRWQAAGGGPVAWPSCGGKWRQYRQAASEPRSSGNHAFDDYRREMLRRLEQDQQDFQSFLDRLRRAKDKAEFDQFMAERDRRPPTEPNGNGQPPHNPWPNA